MATFADYLNPDLSNTFQNAFFENQPQAGMYDVFRNLGITKAKNPLGEFLRNSFGRYYTNYLSQVPYDPSLTFRSFLSGENPTAEFGNLAPRQRGEQPNIFGGKVRYLFNR